MHFIYSPHFSYKELGRTTQVSAWFPSSVFWPLWNKGLTEAEVTLHENILDLFWSNAIGKKRKIYRNRSEWFLFKSIQQKNIGRTMGICVIEWITFIFHRKRHVLKLFDGYHLPLGLPGRSATLVSHSFIIYNAQFETF